MERSGHGTPVGHIGAGQGGSKLGQRLKSTVTACLTLAIFLLAPLPFGAQDSFWFLALLLLLAPVACLGLVGPLSSPERVLLVLILICIIGLGGVVALQSGLHNLAQHPVWADVATATGLSLAGKPVLRAYVPVLDLARAMVPVLALLAGLALARIPSRVSTIFDATIFIGSLIALFWIALFAISPDTVLWRQKLGHQGFLTGTFTNRNTAAAFLAIPLIIGTIRIASIAARLFVSPTRRRPTFFRLIMQSAAWPLRLRLFALLPVLLALLLTGSRAGTIIAMFGMIAGFVLQWRSLIPRRGRLKLLAISILGAAIFAEIFGRGLGQRFSESAEVDSERFSAYMATLRLIGDHPWIGSGLGTFAEAFMPYRPADMPARGLWDRAHNTYLQIATEVGLPMLALALLPVIVVLGYFGRNLGQTPQHPAPGTAGLMLLGGAALHAILDFPIQIPGYSAPFFLTIGFLFARAANPPGNVATAVPPRS